MRSGSRKIQTPCDSRLQVCQTFINQQYGVWYGDRGRGSAEEDGRSLTEERRYIRVMCGPSDALRVGLCNPIIECGRYRERRMVTVDQHSTAVFEAALYGVQDDAVAI